MAKPSENTNRLGQINDALSDIENQFAEIGNRYESPFGDLKDLFLESGKFRLEKLEGLFKEFSDSGIPGLGKILDIVANILGDLLGDLFGGDLFSLENLIPGFLEDLLDELHELVPLDMLDMGGALPGLPSYGDCFRNIDDILVENMQRKMDEYLFKTPVGMGSANLLPVTFEFSNVVEEKIATIVDASPMGIMDLIAGVQSADDALTKVKYIAKLEERLNDIPPEKLECLNHKLNPDAAPGAGADELLNKLLDAENADPCMFAKATGVQGAPVPGCIPSGPAQIFPETIKSMQPNNAQIDLQDEMFDVRWRIGDTLSIEEMAKDWGNSPDHISANTTLQLLTRGMFNAIQNGVDPNIARETFDSNVERILREKERSAEWFAREDGIVLTNDADSAYEYFKTMAPAIATQIITDSPIISGHAAAQDLQTTNAYDIMQTVGHPENPPEPFSC